MRLEYASNADNDAHTRASWRPACDAEPWRVELQSYALIAVENSHRQPTDRAVQCAEINAKTSRMTRHS